MIETTGARTPPSVAPVRPDRRDGVLRPLEPALVAELRRIVGADGVIADPSALLVYESDGLTAYRITPRGVVLPRGTEQVAAVVRCLAGAGVPFVPRGAGTGLSGGALALEGAVVLSLARMDRILDLDPQNRRARVEPGVVNVELARAAAPYGLTYAPDPSSQTACTIGGNVAENAGGPHCLKYGVTTNHVVGLTVVLPDGEVVELGGEPAGYDLVGLFVGSEGTFGVATEIEVKLATSPDAVETLLAIFDRLDDASRAVSAVIAEGLLPAALEMIDRETIRAVEESVFAAGYPVDADAALVIEFDGPRAGLAAEADRARAICVREGAREVRRAADDAERVRLWQGRKKAFGALGRIAPDVLVQDAVVPRTRLPAVLARVAAIGADAGLRIANVFHAGDGNLHPSILFDRRNEAEVERVERASREIMRACIEAGGTITGEHGVGLDKREYMGLVFGDEELAAMCAVRRVFNPRGLANPAKVLPIRVCREWVGPTTSAGAAGPTGAARRAEEGVPGSTPGITHPHPASASELERRAAEVEARAGALAGVPAGAPSSRRRTRDPGALHELLRSLVGPEAILADAAAARWAVHGVAPRAVVAPASAEEAAAVLARASAEGWAVEPAGAGSWLGAGRPPTRIDLVLSTERLHDVVEYEPADLTAAVGAGASHDVLRDRMAEHRQWLPLDPPGAPAGTIGATVSTASAGPLRLGHGTPRDHVLGVQLVTGDGRILELGGRVVKNVAGYDLTKLVVGSRGTLGLITRVNVRLRTFPERDATLSLLAPGRRPLLDIVAAVREARLEPSALELVSPPIARWLLGEAAHWLLLVRLQGNAVATRDAEVRITALARGARRTALDPARAGVVWSRLAALEGEAALSIRLADRPSALSDTVGLALALDPARRGAGDDAPGAGEDVPLAAHAGDGIVRVLADTAAFAAAPVERWAEALASMHAALAAGRGTLSVARAPRRLMERLDPFGNAGAALHLMRGLKAEFDPAGILAPGRFVV